MILLPEVVTSPGQELMDAGRVQFVSGANINLNLANGFKNTDIYCVTLTFFLERTKSSGEYSEHVIVVSNILSFHHTGDDHPPITNVFSCRKVDTTSKSFTRLVILRAGITQRAAKCDTQQDDEKNMCSSLHLIQRDIRISSLQDCFHGCTCLI